VTRVGPGPGLKIFLWTGTGDLDFSMGPGLGPTFIQVFMGWDIPSRSRGQPTRYLNQTRDWGKIAMDFDLEAETSE
jgi:hypothetical protein